MTTIAALLLMTLTPQDIPWKTNWQETLKEAKESKKLAVLVFFNKNLKNCKLYEEETLKDPAVITALKRCVCARIDPDGPDEDNALWQKHGQPGLPMTYVYDPEGNMLTTVTALKAKYYAEALEEAGPAYFFKIVPAREALEKDPNQPDQLVKLGEAYCKLNDPKESAGYFKKAVDLQIQKGDTKGALKTLEAQLKQYYELKWYAPGRECCRKLIELDPSNGTKLCPQAAWVLGMADCAEARWQDAINGMKDACAKYKDCDILDKMMFTLASAYMYAKDDANAIAVFEKIVEQFPDSETAGIAQIQLDKLRK